MNPLGWSNRHSCKREAHFAQQVDTQKGMVLVYRRQLYTKKNEAGHLL